MSDAGFDTVEFWPVFAVAGTFCGEHVVYTVQFNALASFETALYPFRTGHTFFYYGVLLTTNHFK